MQRFRTIIWSLAGLFVVSVLAARFYYAAFISEPLSIPAQGIHFQVHQGDTLNSAIRRLEHLGATRLDWRWKLLTRLHPLTIKTGEYLLTDKMRPLEVLRHLASGDVIQYRFTLVEGWTWRQLRAALLNNELLKHHGSELDADTVMRQLHSDVSSPEGMFLPETYAFVLGDSDLDILQRAHEAMTAELARIWAGRDTSLPVETPYALLTLASLVEKETAVPGERPAIAGVFVRRLKSHWRLETDPAVIYGMGDRFDGNIRKADLRTDTPYNTYVHYGLPPTPIAFPGKSALQAAAHPAGGHAMFFVADGKGGHVFSDTLQEHNDAVQRYQKNGQSGGKN